MGQETPPIQDGPTLYSITCRDAAPEVLLDRLQDLTGKNISVDFSIQARFTLETKEKVTAAELIDLITEALKAEGLRLENVDDQTIRVSGPTNSVIHSTDGNFYSTRRRERTERRRERTDKQISVQQGGPAYPPQGVGSADP